MDDLSSGGALVCFGEEQRLAISMTQMDRLRKIAAEGKSERLQAEKRRIEWLAGAIDRRQELHGCSRQKAEGAAEKEDTDGIH